jgi:hypothetical protein
MRPHPVIEGKEGFHLTRELPGLGYLQSAEVLVLSAYSTETDQAFHAHADQPFHFMPIRSERSDALALLS